MTGNMNDLSPMSAHSRNQWDTCGKQGENELLFELDLNPMVRNTRQDNVRLCLKMSFSFYETKTDT